MAQPEAVAAVQAESTVSQARDLLVCPSANTDWQAAQGRSVAVLWAIAGQPQAAGRGLCGAAVAGQAAGAAPAGAATQWVAACATAHQAGWVVLDSLGVASHARAG